MTDKDKNLKSFLQANTKSQMQKPVNEFSEILGKIENKPISLFRIPKWLYATAAVVAISIFMTNYNVNSSMSANDEQLMAFLSSNLDSAEIYDEDSEDDSSYLSLVN